MVKYQLIKEISNIHGQQLCTTNITSHNTTSHIDALGLLISYLVIQVAEAGIFQLVPLWIFMAHLHIFTYLVVDGVRKEKERLTAVSNTSS